MPARCGVSIFSPFHLQIPPSHLLIPTLPTHPYLTYKTKKRCERSVVSSAPFQLSKGVRE